MLHGVTLLLTPASKGQHTEQYWTEEEEEETKAATKFAAFEGYMAWL